MRQKGFAWGEACAGVVTGGIVQNIEQGLFVGIAGQPGVGLASYCQRAPRSRDCQRLTGLGVCL
jgi:hypothetical protein